MALRKSVKRGPPATKARIKTQERRASTSLVEAGLASVPKYNTIGDVMRAASMGALPRGAMFVIGDGGVELRAKMRGVIETLYAGNVNEVARWGLRKAGFKADHAA